MRIEQEWYGAVRRQLEADCGIESGETGKIRFSQTPRFYAHASLSPQAHARLVQEALQRRTGRCPRVYEGTDPFFRAIFCGREALFMADERILAWCRRTYGDSRLKPEWFARLDNLCRLDRQLSRYGRRLLDCRLNLLPGKEAGEELPGQPFPVRWYEGAELEALTEKEPERYWFRHALCSSELTPCVLTAAALRDGQIAGMAGVSMDSPELWQIGVDVRPEWEGRGLGTALVRLVKREVLRRGKIPFYATSPSHVVSISTAVNAGFMPAWLEVFAGRADRED